MKDTTSSTRKTKQAKTLERVKVKRVSALEQIMLHQIDAAQLPTPDLEVRLGKRFNMEARV